MKIRWTGLVCLVLVSLAMIAAGSEGENVLRVDVFDDAGPRAGIPLRLELYRWAQRGSVTAAVRWYSGDARSDENGEAVFLIPASPDGRALSGTLWVDGIARPVYWPGGEMALGVHLGHITDGMEAGPFDGEVPGDAPVVTGRFSLWRILPVLGAALLVGGVWVWQRREGGA